MHYNGEINAMYRVHTSQGNPGKPEKRVFFWRSRGKSWGKSQKWKTSGKVGENTVFP